MSKAVLNKNNITTVNIFTAFLNDIVDNLSSLLSGAFNDIIQGNFGLHIKRNVRKLFDEWLNRSIIPRVIDTENFLIQIFKEEHDIERLQKLAKRNLVGLNNVDILILNIASDREKDLDVKESIKKNVWISYSNLIFSFTVQTSHFILGRIMMYSVGVDKGVWSQLKLQQVQNPYLELYWTIRKTMKDQLPSLYLLSEFDWFYVEETIREGLDTFQTNYLIRHEELLDKVFGRVIKEFTDAYDFSKVNMDVWKSVYQNFLTEEEVNKLGFVTTPDEIVDLILDLVGYFEDKEGLCTFKILDPACGSGTFLIEALSRLLSHLSKDMNCHIQKTRIPDWQKQQDFLTTVFNLLHGIDIHPFATFLTTINLMFQLIDI